MKKPVLLAVSVLSCLCLVACGGGGGDDAMTAADDPIDTGGTPPPGGGGSAGNIEVAWSPPMQKADGSPLNDLAGYRFYIGESSGQYDDIVTVENAGISRYSFDNLDSGTYFVAMTSYRSNGIESDLSNEVRKSTN